MLKFKREGSGVGSVAAVAAIGTGVSYGSIILLDKLTNTVGIPQPGAQTETTLRYTRKQGQKAMKPEEDK